MQRSDVERCLRLARACAADELPFLAPALFSARLVLTDACPSLAAVDNRMCVYFHPELTAQLIDDAGSTLESARQLAFVWVHEISHVLRDHAARAGDIGADK